MRVGVFGGSFNPIHLGHLRAAEEDREAMGLDLVYFVPAASPPHKPHAGLAPAEHRLQMVRLATKGNRHFMVSDTEIRRPGQSYTIDTVRYFLSTMRGPSEIHLIMGADQFAELNTWREADELVRLCNLAVHTRESGGGEDAPTGSACDNRLFWLQSRARSLRAPKRPYAILRTHYFPPDISHNRPAHYRRAQIGTLSRAR